MNLSGELSQPSLGIRERKVELNACRIPCVDLESSITFQTFVSTTVQQFWKNSVVNPSFLGDFPVAISMIVPSISSGVIFSLDSHSTLE